MYWVRGIGIFFLGVMAVVGMSQDVIFGILAMIIFGIFTCILGS